MKLNGSQILIACLKEQNVDTVFGCPGGAIENVYDELYRNSDEIRCILTSHEQGASHAADGYARASGKVGVCFASSGSGATDLVTGIATAYMDSVPIVAITCNVGLDLLGRDSFQEIDITGVTMPITKHNFIVKDASRLADTIRSAFLIAKEGRPGPVLVDLTRNATADLAEYVPPILDPVKEESLGADSSQIENALKLIAKSKKPFVFVGGGAAISDCRKELKEFVEILDAPVADSLMGKGAFDGTDDRYMGMLGMNGTEGANCGVDQCDLLVAVGVRFSDRVIGNSRRFARRARIIQIDIDAAEINKNVLVDAGIIGDAGTVLRELNRRMEPMDHSDWMKTVIDRKEHSPWHDDETALTGQAVIEEIYRQTGGDAIIVSEGSRQQMWAARYYRYKEPHRLLTSGGLGTEGFGLGAAIGAKMGRPDKTVINIAGYGCLRRNMNELATLGRYQIPVIEVVIGSHVPDMIRPQQNLLGSARNSQAVPENVPDFIKVAESCGVTGIRVQKRKELPGAIEKALKLCSPVLIDCIIGMDDKAKPMAAAKHPVDDVFGQG